MQEKSCFKKNSGKENERSSGKPAALQAIKI